MSTRAERYEAVMRGGEAAKAAERVEAMARGGEATQAAEDRRNKAVEITATQAAIEGIREVISMYPGLSWGKIWEDLKHEFVEQVKHGSHEIAAAINNGSAFVMYSRGEGRDDDHKQPEQVPEREH